LTLRSDIAKLGTGKQDIATLRAAATDIAGPKGVRLVVGRRLALYPQTEMNEGEWAAWWADYTDALADVALTALEEGMAEWVRRPTSQFMPKPGELRGLALSTPNAAQIAYDRATKEAARPPARAWSPISDDEYGRLSVFDKIWQHRKMADYERGRAGAQHSIPAEMPEKWHHHRALAANHDAEASRLEQLSRAPVDVMDLLE
jgi:hypothetical protein